MINEPERGQFDKLASNANSFGSKRLSACPAWVWMASKVEATELAVEGGSMHPAPVDACHAPDVEFKSMRCLTAGGVQG